MSAADVILVTGADMPRADEEAPLLVTALAAAGVPAVPTVLVRSASGRDALRRGPGRSRAVAADQDSAKQHQSS